MEPAAPIPTPPHVAEAPAAETYGRVEPDGTVWVRTSSGEVRVGQYQAGDLDQALGYFARKYRTLEVEVEVLEQRLASGADVSIDDAQASVERLKAALVEPQVVGDIDGLLARVERLGPLLEARRQAVRAQKTALREAAKAERERIVSEAEALADSTSLEGLRRPPQGPARGVEGRAARRPRGRADDVEALLCGPELL